MRPQAEIASVMDYVMVLLDKPTGWPNVRKELVQSDFISRVCALKPDSVSPELIK